MNLRLDLEKLMAWSAFMTSVVFILAITLA